MSRLQATMRKYGSGLFAPIPFLCLVFTLALSLPAGALAQQQPQPAPSPSGPAPVVDSMTVAKLVWSSMAALDHANKTGNYSVLRDLGAPSFQSSNSAATLGGIFTALRSQQVDLSNTLVIAPAYEFPPAIVQGGLLRVRGTFPLRPVAILFDLLFQNVNGQWLIFGIAVAPGVAPATQPPPTRR